MTGHERERRVIDLMALAHDLIDYAEETLGDGRIVATVGLFSGGNDSTVLMHLLRGRLTHAAHANTTIGIEQTRQYVRDTCSAWNIPLIEHTPDDKDSFRSLVLDQGFPGPGHHWKMFQRLKERPLRKVVRDLKHKRRDRLMFVAGRRRSESARRANVPEMERRNSVIWVSPLVLWTAPDMTTYRLMCDNTDPVPVNEVSNLLHMSGECLCGAFARRGELNEIAMWFPDVAADIRALEAQVRDNGIPEPRCWWGWGANQKDFAARILAAKSGPLCTSCDDRIQTALDI
jgi:3'-phosphoadenosine 5'-phosphosulfate sulfotransferase (PAPS reductase)/FAD synthetase